MNFNIRKSSLKYETHVIPKLRAEINKVHKRHVTLAYCSNSLCPHAFCQG